MSPVLQDLPVSSCAYRAAAWPGLDLPGAVSACVWADGDRRLAGSAPLSVRLSPIDGLAVQSSAWRRTCAGRRPPAASVHHGVVQRCAILPASVVIAVRHLVAFVARVCVSYFYLNLIQVQRRLRLVFGRCWVPSDVGELLKSAWGIITSKRFLCLTLA